MTAPHKQNDILGDRYKIIELTGEGGMQHVFKANDKILDRIVALKTPKNNSAEKRFHRSAKVSAKVNHPNVAKTLDYFIEGERQYLIEEFVEGADMDAAFLKKADHLDPYLVARIFHYLARGLAASHHADVVHRDIKPTNVMVSGGFELTAIKITDFGIARMASAEIIEVGGDFSASKTAIGAIPYMAPEAILTPTEVNKPADVWSVGAMVFELLAGVKPFGNGLTAVPKILSGMMPAFPPFITSNPQFKPLAEELIALILSCLNTNPALRPTADQLVSACGNLYYPISPRISGTVGRMIFPSQGFITSFEGDVFFHRESVYGQMPSVGEAVSFSKFQGTGSDRAHPIIKIRN